MPGSSAQDKLMVPAGTVKIKVAEDGYLVLKEARKVEFDGRRYSIVSDNKPYGMFGPKYYSFFLSPINE
jgi:type IV secretory pathway protease TraF